MKKFVTAAIGLASLIMSQCANADVVQTYDINAYLFWHQTQTDGAPTSLTGKVTYDYTTNLFTQADIKVGPYQFSMNSIGAPYTNEVVYNSVALDMSTTCALPAGRNCSNGLQSNNLVELTISPLEVGPTASDSYTHYGTLPFQFQGLLGTSEPTPTGQHDLAMYIGHGSVSAVPEPETYALIVAGLILLGMALRRKQFSIFGTNLV